MYSLFIGGDDVGTSAARAKDDLILAAFGHNERARLIVLRERIGVGTNRFCCFRVIVWLATTTSLIRPSTAVLIAVVLLTCRIAWVERRSGNVAVRIRIYTITLGRWRVDLTIPGAPF